MKKQPKSPLEKLNAPLVVDKGIPLPPRNTILEGGVTETIRSMEVGDSFVIAFARRSQVLTVADRIGVMVATRRISVDEIRVWKTGVERHGEKLAARREQSRREPVPYKQPKPPRTPAATEEAAPPVIVPKPAPLPDPVPVGHALPLEPIQSAAICKEAGVNVNRFSPLLAEWKERGVTEKRLREALELGARSTQALDEVFRA